MDLNDIKQIPVADLAAKNAVCLMWVVNPLLPQGIETLQAWGFTYKTVAFTWVKQNKKSPTYFTGLGYYTRANPEICILGTKGKPLPRKSRSVPNLCVSPIREHSRKPDEIITRIETLFDGPYVELFSRTTRNGWDVFGNQTDKFSEEAPEGGAAADPVSFFVDDE
jgi:N6-adenosine-specific RNA methylase IME4